MSSDNGRFTLANPSPLGLLGFGMTTVLLNLHNAGLIKLSVVIVAMGFALGGGAQIVAVSWSSLRIILSGPRLLRLMACSGGL